MVFYKKKKCSHFQFSSEYLTPSPPSANVFPIQATARPSPLPKMAGKFNPVRIMWPNVSVTVSTTSGFGIGCAIVVVNYEMTNKSSVDRVQIVSLC